MRRMLVVFTLFLAVIGLLAAPAQAVTPKAQIVTIQYEVVGDRLSVVYVNGNITCNDGLSFLGRVTARHEPTKETISIFKIAGECTGDFVSWEPKRTEILGSVPCPAEVTIGGQVRLSNGVRVFVRKSSITCAG